MVLVCSGHALWLLHRPGAKPRPCPICARVVTPPSRNARAGFANLARTVRDPAAYANERAVERERARRKPAPGSTPATG
jgi:hypothetical protein